MTVVNKCRPANAATNKWCLKDLYAVGEGSDLIFLPITVWGQIKQRWLTTAVGESAPMILAPEAGSTLVSYLYNEPTATPETVLFPDGGTEKDGLYFPGTNLMFSPTVGNAIEADGVPYQTSNISLPVGSNRDYDELVQYLQSKAWVGIKIAADTSTMHVYGGPRGYFPKADEVAEMLYSGNNETKGKTAAAFEAAKSNYVIEYIKLGEQTKNKNALLELMGYIKDGACKENGTTTA